MLGSLYLLMASMLVIGALINRRERFAKLFTMFLAWIAIFGAGVVLFSFRDDLAYVGERLKAEATGSPVVEAQGEQVRIPMAIAAIGKRDRAPPPMRRAMRRLS